MASPYLYLFMAGAGVLAMWLDARFPNLAPQSFSKRIGAAVAACLLLHLLPMSGTSVMAVYATLFVLVLPAFIGSFLTALWLLRFLRDARTA
jgi:hypothetical protein